ncbi:hypothetical protein BDQ17DRAFT_1248290 [Cyathus striatus]|nr:hypothetical protein BDQ17DRAFT_1248290 [Cyathus striatus]
MMATPPKGKKFYLFRYPIAHSAAPAFHNLCFDAWGTEAPNTYELCSTSKVTKELWDVLMNQECDGAAVTMPLGPPTIPFLDDVSPESRVTGACNTIVKVLIPEGVKLVGQNTAVRSTIIAFLSAIHSF